MSTKFVSTKNEPLFLLINLVAMEATREESRPPDSNTPHGTSLIILRLTAWESLRIDKKNQNKFEDKTCYLKSFQKGYEVNLCQDVRTASKASLRATRLQGFFGIAAWNEVWSNRNKKSVKRLENV